MQQLKIKEHHWCNIISGEKLYEFRKLSKGVVNDTYEFVSIVTKLKEVNTGTPYARSIIVPEKEYGTAQLIPFILNPSLVWENSKPYIVEGNHYYKIDDRSYWFIKDNYISKGIDFIAYRIANVQEGEYNE